MQYGFNQFYIAVIVLVLSAIELLHLYRNIKLKYKINNAIPKLIKITNKYSIIMICILLTICVRGYVGLILNFTWKANFYIALTYVLGVVLGKMLGGIVADRLGFMKTTITSLSVSSILFVFSFNNAIIGIIAVLLFNMTMPITLIVLSNMFNNNKGFAFGLTTFALFIGAIPVLLGYNKMFFDSLSLFIIIILSVIALFIGLKGYYSMESSK